MAQQLIQTQTQQQIQQQRLSQQQMLEVKLLEMPLAELEQNISAELDDNPALEERRSDDDPGDSRDDMTGGEDDYGGEETADSDLDNALSDLESDDRMPSADSRLVQHDANGAEEEERVWGDTTSFYDRLKEQLGVLDLNEQDRKIMEYLIGSLDTDGLLRKPLDSICDELAIYEYIDVTEAHLEQLLKQLQTFDPAGIGARSLQECLLLQIARKPKGRLRELMREVIEKHYNSFIRLHWDHIAASMHISDEEMKEVRREIRKLNPKPGSSLGETEGKNLQQVTPDFIIDTDEDGNVSFTLNRGHVPDLVVSRDFSDMVDAYRKNKKSMSRRDKEALLYAKQKVDRAQGYIEAIRQRQHTLSVTMQAIIDWQKKFFQSGDEADLRPMILKDIAGKTHLDVSTISRVSNVKHAQTPWGVFPLRYFFSDGYKTDEGEDVSTRKIKIAMKEVVDKEDKQKPLSDEEIAARMEELGYPIARRTVSKYRDRLGIPAARLRKE